MIWHIPRFSENVDASETRAILVTEFATQGRYKGVGPPIPDSLAFQPAPNAQRITQAGRSYLLPAFARKAESHVRRNSV